MKSIRTGTFRPRPAAQAPIAVICCLFPSTRNTRWRTRSGSRRSASSNAAAIIAGDVSGDRGRYPLIARDGTGVLLAAGRRGGDVPGFAGGGGGVGDRDDLGHLLDP